MKTYKVRYYIRSLITFSVVEAENGKAAAKVVRDSKPRGFAGIASVEEVK